MVRALPRPPAFFLSEIAPHLGLLSSTGVTQRPQSYGPLRHPDQPFAGFRFARAIAAIPAEPLGARVVHLPQRRRPSSNVRRVGSCITLFGACSAFTARYGLYARQVPYRPSTPEASAASTHPRPFRLLPAGTTVAGWESHPPRELAVPRHTDTCNLSVIILEICIKQVRGARPYEAASRISIFHWRCFCFDFFQHRYQLVVVQPRI